MIDSKGGLLLAIALAACGTRTELGLPVGEDDGSAVDAPGGAPSDAPTPQAPPSCWSAPNCIEADIAGPMGLFFYREMADVEPTTKVLWMHGETDESVSITIKLFRDAMEGVEPFDAENGNVFLTLETEDSGCPLAGDIVLETVDVEPGGVTTAAFGGDLNGCPTVGTSIEGRFKLSAP